MGERAPRAIVRRLGSAQDDLVEVCFDLAELARDWDSAPLASMVTELTAVIGTIHAAIERLVSIEEPAR